MDLKRGVLLTGADGELGAALRDAFADTHLIPLTRADWDVTLPPPPALPAVDVVLHAAAVLRSQRADAPRLPHLREGLRDCRERPFA